MNKSRLEEKETSLKSFKVRVLNESLDIQEKITRLVSTEGTALLRKATLNFKTNNIELGCQDDSGTYHKLAKLPYEVIKKIKYKKSAITLAKQLIKPIMSGVFLGIGLCIVIWFKVKDIMAVSPLSYGELIGIMIGTVLFFALLMTIFNLGKITFANLSIVLFEGNNNKNLEFAIEDNNLEQILEITKSRNIEESLLR